MGVLAPVSVTDERSACCRDVLEALPQWFGRPSALEAYVCAAGKQPMLACFSDKGVVVGILSLKLHGTDAGEIHVLGVKPAWHRQGIGRALVVAAKAQAAAQGLRLMTVKTLAPSHPDPHYAATRRFYEAMGFLSVEEIPDLWGPETPCLLMAMPVGPQAEASEAGDMDIVQAGELRLLDAAARALTEEVDNLLHDDFVEFGSSGIAYDKVATIAALAAETRAGSSIDREARDLSMRRLGPAAMLVTYKVVRHPASGTERLSLRSSIWVRTEVGWRMLFHQGTLAGSRRVGS